MRKYLAWGFAALIALASPALAQRATVIGGVGSGSGTVTNVATGACLTGGPITTTGTIAGTQASRQSNLTTDAIVSSDACLVVSYQNAGTKAISIAQATGAFGDGWGTEIANEGAGLLTLTPTTSTVNGAPTLTIAENRSCYIYSISGNYKVSACTALVTGGSVAVGDITGLGTGVATWLATPSSANLASTVTDETGTGALFFAGGNAGTFTGTTLALGGCTIGANSLCTVGGADFAGNLNIAATVGFTLGVRIRLSSPGNNFVQWGTSSSTPPAYSFGVGNGSGTNIAGANTTFIGSLATGNANSGDFLFQTGGALGASGTTGATATTALRIRGVNGRLSTPLITSDSGLTTSAVCQDTTTHDYYSGSAALGACAGTSSRRFKHDITPLPFGIHEIMALKPVSYKLNKDKGDPNKELYGFIAEDMVGVLPKLVGLDKQGRPTTADYLGIIPVLVKAVQEQQREIAALKKQISERR